MRWFYYTLFIFTLAISGCSGEQTIEKSIVGTWLQETPTSTTASGLQTTTADTVLTLKKNGETKLTRSLDIAGQGLPGDGVKIKVELRGEWEIIDGKLKQTQNTALIIPRTEDKMARDWADQLQAQADKSQSSVKDIILIDKGQLIVQDTETGTTDIYRRK